MTSFKALANLKKKGRLNEYLPTDRVVSNYCRRVSNSRGDHAADFSGRSNAEKLISLYSSQIYAACSGFSFRLPDWIRETMLSEIPRRFAALAWLPSNSINRVNAVFITYLYVTFQSIFVTSPFGKYNLQHSLNLPHINK